MRDVEILTDLLVKKDTHTVGMAVQINKKGVEANISGSEMKLEFQSLNVILTYLKGQKQAVRFGDWSDQDRKVIDKYQLLTAKEFVYVLNMVSRACHTKGR